MRRNFEKAEAAASQQENPTRTSRLRIERIVLLVLGFLLAAALIVIYRLAFQMIQTNQAVQTLKEENEVLRRNVSEINQCSPCSPPPKVKNETCWKCEAGWELHGGNCYYFSTNKSSWENGRRLCKDLEGDLVKIDSRDEQIFLAERLKELMKDDDDKFWIGLTDSAEEGRWLWVDGSLLNESFWKDQEPDNLSKDGASQADCGRMGEKKGVDNLKSWFDISCLYLQKSICEKGAGTIQSSSVCV
ncbi:PREDICTED: C-type lectin domain family 4 member E-like [Cyprinodon variegatus]|uniref:C-type lectin domain family 4 member E-like n=1 Tax=Cyprinodon variegatus TaxID=28743 RepID=A0A3Q2DXB0_CYPVA|nr:PREDICTED: C-type lectin domain family 4 member E-like [Cyprinodon variegatus]XP_015256526.1 PREDICTED: C-type lectin domain family 4 member E-like [Cyprinodon variegatus]XP_015256527.1 PREDICTED: C-type lectin domain family 4 member E-like [Cyprinodon variegatus]